jgi:3-isopropylmalate/(R)-2-methylmalate dehydratase small subunit
MTPFTTLDAVAAPMESANIDTDQIVPARFIQKPRAADFGEFLFLDVRHPDFVLNQRPYANAQIIVAGRNFGCGSSREHAVWALVDGGIRAVIAPSFGDIFHSNSLKNGLLPVVLPAASVVALLAALRAAPGAHVRVDLVQQTVTGPDMAPMEFSIDAFSRQCLLEGLDEIAYSLGQMAGIEAFENRMKA